MIPRYEENNDSVYIVQKVSEHAPPHLHNALEIVYVTEGSLEFGIADELYPMKKGDLAFAFPDVIHHYQTFVPESGQAIYVHALPVLAGQFQEQIQMLCPEYPVIEAKNVHPDIVNALYGLLKNHERTKVVDQAYIQIILAQAIPYIKLIEKSSIGSNDIVYRTVLYIADHFKENLSLDSMAKNLCVSKYVLSRVFSGTFHSNFNQYLNEQRLRFAVMQLENSSRSITDICLEAGFQSQRTFNRAFQERYKMSPREYRKACREKR